VNRLGAYDVVVAHSPACVRAIPFTPSLKPKSLPFHTSVDLSDGRLWQPLCYPRTGDGGCGGVEQHQFLSKFVIGCIVGTFGGDVVQGVGGQHGPRSRDVRMDGSPAIRGDKLNAVRHLT
jgi:hypothetical protein